MKITEKWYFNLGGGVFLILLSVYGFIDTYGHTTGIKSQILFGPVKNVFGTWVLGAIFFIWGVYLLRCAMKERAEQVQNKKKSNQSLQSDAPNARR